MEQIIPLLTDPGAHGADPADAFDLVVPSLPGYGFSARPDRPGVGPHHVAGLWAELMAGLGYQRFGAQGGDWGASVSTWLAFRFPDQVAGLHLNFIPGSFLPPLDAGQPPPSAEEQAFRARASGMGRRRRRLRPYPRDEAADASLCAGGFPGWTGVLDCREISRLERL